MFTTLDEFYNNYRIKNNDVPDEITLNKGIMRLKREIREIKSLVDIIMGIPLEEWNPSKYYESDEYITYNGSNYKSKVMGNKGLEPGVSSDWELVDTSNISTQSLFDVIGELSGTMERNTPTDDTDNLNDVIGTFTLEEQ